MLHTRSASKLKGLAISLCIPAIPMAAFNYFNLNNPPASLSATGLYTNMATKAMDTAAKAYEVNAPLWSDGAVAKRWILLRPGKKMAWVDSTDLFDYPDSTVFVKNFYMVMGLAPTDTVIWETQLLLYKKTTREHTQNWWGYSYRWNAAQNEAKLVDLSLGFDTAFTYVDFTGKSTYKKWRFPSQGACYECHIGRTGSAYPNASSPPGLGRGILGFMPMQLKRPIALAGGATTDQVLQLFDRGVFTGTLPNAAALSKRFIGIHEPIPSTSTPSERFAIIDNQARSYLAANCSGCHGDRAGSIVVTGARIPPNFDFHDLKHHDLPFEELGSGFLTDTSSHTDSLDPPTGYAKLKWLVEASGLNKSPYWNMAIPPGEPLDQNSKVIFVDPLSPERKGYPAFSNALYRMMARKMLAHDSASWAQELNAVIVSGGGFGNEAIRASAIKRWIFSAPWGSKAWVDTLKNHNFTLDTIMAGYYRDNSRLNRDADQMPPLSTFLPDTSALKVLAEWVTYKGVIPNPGQASTSIRRHRNDRAVFKSPVIQNRVLLLPEGWKGKVHLLDLRGRAMPLQSVGDTRYVLPASLKPGLLLFQIGDKHFKAYLF
jgi:hypothetical protein